MRLRYTQSGHIFIGPKDDPQSIARAMVKTGCDEEFCIADNFAPDFIARLMAAGFLVMSMGFDGPGDGGGAGSGMEYILLPKLHLERSIIFFENFHEPCSARRLIPRYELRVDLGADHTGDFDVILDRCAAVHGEDWLTPPLRESIRAIRRRSLREPSLQTGSPAVSNHAGVQPVSFGLYREERLAAGEFGVVAGKVYTSYSGYYDEDSAGTVQLILTGRYLRDAGFAFWDLGMPLEYKTRLGARSVDRENFLKLRQFQNNEKGCPK
ncbi:hypothetical protein AGMMS49546_16840 [Spirochaetia bacterium]|nr:hypothetical protein AGMMS49546_16840 [Spirochaetia bacterium]